MSYAYRAKELEWDVEWNGDWLAQTLIGEYRIDIQEGRFTFQDGQGNTEESKTYKTFDKCKDACQAHYAELWQSGGAKV